jgi:hypothetical protein
VDLETAMSTGKFTGEKSKTQMKALPGEQVLFPAPE